MARWAALLLLSGAAAYLHPGSSPNLHRRAIAGAGRRGLSSMRCSSTDLGDVAHSRAVIPGLRSEWSRRVVLFGAALTAAVPRVARAYDFTRETSGDTVFDVPDVWRKTASDAESGTFAFSNPVSGKVLDQIIVREFEAPQGITSTKDLGKIEKIKPSKAFGATKEVWAVRACLCVFRGFGIRFLTVMVGGRWMLRTWSLRPCARGPGARLYSTISTSQSLPRPAPGRTKCWSAPACMKRCARTNAGCVSASVSCRVTVRVRCREEVLMCPTLSDLYVIARA